MAQLILQIILRLKTVNLTIKLIYPILNNSTRKSKLIESTIHSRLQTNSCNIHYSRTFISSFEKI